MSFASLSIFHSTPFAKRCAISTERGEFNLKKTIIPFALVGYEVGYSAI